MKKSDIYEVAIKLLGIYKFISIFWIFEYFLVTIFNSNQENPFASETLIINSVSLAVSLIIIWALLFKTKYIVSKICHKDDLEISWDNLPSKKTVLNISLVISGLILLTTNIAGFIVNLKFFYYKIADYGFEKTVDNERALIISGISLFVGLIMVLFSDYISSKLIKQDTSAND